METALEIIERRIRFWEAKLHRAEGKYHSDSINLNEQSRIAAMHDCKRCETVLIVLHGLIDEIREVQ